MKKNNNNITKKKAIDGNKFILPVLSILLIYVSIAGYLFFKYDKGTPENTAGFVMGLVLFCIGTVFSAYAIRQY
jgi:hypothetical protein